MHGRKAPETLAAITSAEAGSIVLMPSEADGVPLACDVRPASWNQGLLLANGQTHGSDPAFRQYPTWGDRSPIESRLVATVDQDLRT